MRSILLYWFLKFLLTPVLFAVWRMRVPGWRRVPLRGPAILASNHLSFMDSIFLPASVVRRVTFVAKAEYFDTWRTRWFFGGTGQIPIQRDGGSASDRAMATAREVLQSGRLMGIYPEGTRSPDGRLHRGKTGAARLALDTGVPLIPVGLVGTSDVMPAGSKWFRFRPRVSVRFGAPLDTSKYRSWSDQAAAARALTDELMAAIQDLSGQDYVDEYAADVKEGRLAPRAA